MAKQTWKAQSLPPRVDDVEVVQSHRVVHNTILVHTYTRVCTHIDTYVIFKDIKLKIAIFGGRETEIPELLQLQKQEMK